MKLRKSYKTFDTKVVRTPLYSLAHYNMIPKEEKDLILFVQDLFKNATFKEAIFLASPELFYEWKKSIEIEDCSSQKQQQLCKSVLKYYIRSITNCIPFGLFASYGISKASDTVGNSLEESKEFKRFTGVDISFLSQVIEQLQSHRLVQEKLHYRINDTAYTNEISCRYIESSRSNSGDRNFTLSDVDVDAVLQLIMSSCNTAPKTKKELIQLLMDHVEDVTLDQVTYYIEDLINSQIIVSSLGFCLNGSSPFSQVLDFVTAYVNDHWNDDPFLSPIISVLKTIKTSIDQLDAKVTGNEISEYEVLYDAIQSLDWNVDKNIINTDLKRVHIPQKLSHNKEEDDASLQEAIQLLSAFATQKPEKKYTSHKNLEAFKKAFRERYDDAEVPLLEALDKETGIGYIQSLYDGSSSWLIDDLKFPESISFYEDITCDTKADTFWFKTIMGALKNGETSIDLKGKDISTFENRTSTLRGTFPLVYAKSEGKIFITSAGGATAAHYIGRFMSNDKELTAFGDEISEAEKTLFPDKILAEVTHLTTYKGGNIAMRHIHRDYEIPIFENTSTKAKKIDLNDMLISVRGGKIMLRSKKLNKEIIPFLSCAQNYHYGTISIYHFLCDLQSQYRSNLLSLDLNKNITQHFSFIPRIEYDNRIVLSLARWRFTMSECKSFLDDTNTIVFDAFQDFKKKHKIPRYINLSEGGGEPLTLDTENEFMLGLMAENLKKGKRIMFTESMYQFSDLNNTPFANEHVVSFKGNPLATSLTIVEGNTPSFVKKNFIPGDEWFYFNVYTGANIADKILTTVIKNVIAILKEKGLIDKWFFIRYNDPKFHLRIRFHFTDPSCKNDVITIFNTYIQPYVDNKSIWKLQLATYERELERYYHHNIGQSETIFSHDSDLVINLLQKARENNDTESLWLYSLQSIDSLLDAFEIPLEEKQYLLFQFYKSFYTEFKADKKVRKQIDLKYRGHIDQLEDILSKRHVFTSLFEDRTERIQPAVAHLKKNLTKAQIYNLIASHVHMCINRLTKTNPRMHELVLYGILEKYYKRCVGIAKYSAKKELV